MRVPNAEESLGILVVPPCLKCQQPFEVRPLHISDVDHCVQYWSCASCGCVWATRDGEDLPSTRRRREIRNPHETSSLTAACDYDDAVQVRLEAAMLRTQRLINSTQPVRARPQHGQPFSPFCMSCQQSGRRHASAPLTFKQNYVCANCQRRWVTLPSAG
jgi:hypothetical protein